MSDLLPTLISSERDPNNVPPLLEASLAYLAAFGGRRAGDGGGAWDAMDPSRFAKGLSRTLRRACHGSDPARWGPVMLPLIASLPPPPGGGTESTPLELQGELNSSLVFCEQPSLSVPAVRPHFAFSHTSFRPIDFPPFPPP